MSSYTSHAANEAEELRASLSEDDREHLRADLEQLGFDGWIDWAVQNQSEANDYLRATEKQRAKKKKWQEPVLRRRLCLSAYHQARLASAMLDEAAMLGPGGGYRDTTAQAASAYFRVLIYGSWRWPFDEPAPPPEWPGPHREYWRTEFRAMGRDGKTVSESREGYDAT